MSQNSIAFDRAAGYYDQTRGFPPGVEREIAALMARTAGLSADVRVLEIGIGTGRIALPLAPYVGAYYGIDLAGPMLDRLIEKRNGEPVYPLIGDATRLPFADATFDAAIAVHIFHLIPAYREAFAEVARVLKPGAVLAHGWNDRHEEDILQKVWNEAIQYGQATTLEEASNSPQPVPFVERAGMLPNNGWRLQSEDHTAYTIERTPAGFLKDMAARVYSHCWSMPDDVLENGLAAVRAFLSENAIDPDRPRQSQSVFRVQTFLPPG